MMVMDQIMRLSVDLVGWPVGLDLKLAIWNVIGPHMMNMVRVMVMSQLHQKAMGSLDRGQTQQNGT
jgi:hypothetical protein